MKAVATLFALENLKAAMRVGHIRDAVPPRRRADAIACGLGFKNMGILQKKLKSGPLLCDISDEAFVAQLAENGYTKIDSGALSKAVGISMFVVDFSGDIPVIRAPSTSITAGWLLGTSGSPDLIQKINKNLNGGQDAKPFFGLLKDRFAKIRAHFIKKIIDRDLEGEVFVRQLLSEHHARTTR